MNYKKLEADETATDFDKVLLITGHINWLANNLNNLTRDYQIFLPHKITEPNNVHSERYEWNKKIMSECVAELNAVREKLAEYLNGCDAVADIDVALGEAVFNIINDIEPESDYMDFIEGLDTKG